MKTERRAVARYRDKIAVKIAMDEYELDAESMEISLWGLRVECTGPIANNLFSKYLQVSPGENIRADILIKIPKAHGLVNTLTCQGKVISVSRISQTSYITGFNIIEFEGEDQQVWHDYISTKR